MLSGYSGPGGHGGDGGDGGSGAALYGQGTLSLVACTVGANAGGDGGPGGNGYGGYQATGGTGGTGGSGAGISTSGAANNALIAQNLVGTGGPGGYGSVYNGNSGQAGSGPDLAGYFTSLGHNLIGQTNGAFGFTNGVNGDLAGSAASPLDPKLSPLQNNGGLTLTMSLLPGSPAIDAGDDALLAAPFNLGTDQRGLPRKFGAHVDIGAFEFQVASLPLSLASLTSLGGGAVQLAFTNTPGATFTVLATTNVSLPVSNWSALGAPTEQALGEFQYTDPQATNNPQRFYRLRSP